MKSITLIKPDDWHLHVRDGEVLAQVLAHTAKRFARAIIMPNLKPPVTTTEQAQAYRQRILDALPNGTDFTPLMTLYLTDNTQSDEIRKAKQSAFVHAIKYYPAGATTNSESGVTDIKHTYHTLETMQKEGMPLLLHGEVTDPGIDIFDREKIFIDTVLLPIQKNFPELRIVLEHITTRDAVEYVQAAPDNIAATITPQHLLYNRNALFRGGLRPHYFCLPVLKREDHRQALMAVATSGNQKFFLGTDSAPHARSAKESACGCAGIYSAHAALELYTEVFAGADALDKLEGFASLHGADFYQLPRNTQTITLINDDWQVPDAYPFSTDQLIPLLAGETINWRIKN